MLLYLLYWVMEAIKDVDLHKAYQIFDRLQEGEVYSLDRIPKERRDLFIKCCKFRIDYENDLELNNDYTKIKKTFKL